MDEEPRTASWAPGRTTPTAVRPRLVPLPEPGTVLAERFVIEAVLGKGGTGVVYVARDRQLGQRVAIKLLHPDLVNDVSRERLRREVQAARHGHANVVTVYDLHDDGGPMPFLSMELVEGCSLAHVLGHERRRLGIEETIAIGRQVAAALDHLHAHGLVHRDVKPSNILVTAGGTAKVCDLGLVRLLERGETLTATAMTVGTPAYMAPEQGSGGELTPAADVYALGLTLYECLTGKVPHAGESAIDTLVRRQSARPPVLRRDDPACPRWLERLLSRMLEPRPADRPSAIAVARAFETRRVRRRVSRRAALAAAAALALAAGGALGWRALAARETVRVEVVGAEVRGVDARDRPTWRLALAGPASLVERADLDGDGHQETIAVSKWVHGDDAALIAGARPATELVAVTMDGRVVTRFVPASAVAMRWSHPFAPVFTLGFQTADLDRDGFNEIVLNAAHQPYYPNALFAYWPRWDLWDWLLDHTGRIESVDVVADPAEPLLRVLGWNNRLSMLPVYGEVAVVPPARRFTSSGLEAPSPLPSPQDGIDRAAVASWRDYVLFPENTKPMFVHAGDGGRAHVVSSSDRTSVDEHGNVVPGPNANRDLRQARLALVAGVASLRALGTPLPARAVHERAASLRGRVAPLLAEAPYRAVLDLAEARALTRTGDAATATALLRGTWAAVPYEDVGFRLAHLQALSGQRHEAIDTLRSIIDNAHNHRGWFDAPHLLVRVATEARDREALTYALEHLGRSELSSPKNASVAAALLARARLWWDVPSAVDERVAFQVYTPDAEAVACLARWRLGHARAEDVEAMRAFIARVPDAVPDGNLALAAAQLAAGAAVDAVATLDRLIFTISLDAREDFGILQIRDLAEAIRCKALLAAGRPADARAAAAELLPRLTPGLLPSILCREVIGAGGGAGGPT